MACTEVDSRLVSTTTSSSMTTLLHCRVSTPVADAGEPVREFAAVPRKDDVLASLVELAAAYEPRLQNCLPGARRYYRGRSSASHSRDISAFAAVLCFSGNAQSVNIQCVKGGRPRGNTQRPPNA